MNRWRFVALAVILIQVTLWGQECLLYDYSGEAYPAQATELYRGEKFSVQLPKGWPKKIDAIPYRTDHRSAQGIEVNGPERDGVNVKMIFAYYANGGMFKNHQGYVNVRSNSFVRTDPEKKIIVHPTKVDGKQGVTFEMETFELVYEPTFKTIDPEPGMMYKMGYHPSSNERLAPTKRVLVWNKDVVIPLKKGFFVARFDIPAALASECAQIVDTLIASIRLEGGNAP